MIFESIIGNVKSDEPNIDWVTIDFTQTVRRALRLVSEQGRPIDLLLPRGTTLRDGDVVGQIDDQRIAIRVRPVDLIELHPDSIEISLHLATELGNLHYPVQIKLHCILTLDDGPVQELAERFQIRFTRLTAPFHPLRSSLMASINDRTNP